MNFESARVETPGPQTLATIVAQGEFGWAVAERLTRQFAGARVQDHLPAPGAGHPIILASWREARSLGEAIDMMVGVPWWIPVVLAHPVIRVGPVFSHDVPGCYRCLTSRVLAREEQPEHLAALWDLYDHDPSIGPPGYLAHHAGVAAGLTALVVNCRDEARRLIVTYDLLTADLRAERLVPTPDCPRWPRTSDGVAHD